MNTIRVVGIDIAKSVFQVCVWMVDGSVAWNKKISRQKLLDTLRQFESGTSIAMEACSTSHFWGRTLSSMEYSVRLIPAQHVKAFISEVDAVQFSNGRELSAWCGLVPRQHSSGGKQRLSSVTKNGNRSLRTLVIHGARSVMRCVKKRDDNLGL